MAKASGMGDGAVCPGCGGRRTWGFYEVGGVPVHSVLQMRTREMAVGYARGDIRLMFCEGCGFVFNGAYDGGLLAYGGECEEGQGFSATFGAFHRRLAEHLVERYGLRGKRILEIGCGKGDFLTLLCELGGNEGVGYDPAYVAGRFPEPRRGRAVFVAEDFTAASEVGSVDFVCCKMTLEHIEQTGAFAEMVAGALGGRGEAVVFFQVPETERVFGEGAFWEVYYEHSSYFGRASLRAVFERAGFVVEEVWVDYGGQYLMLSARVGGGQGERGAVERDEGAALGAMRAAAERFAEEGPTRVAVWREYFAEAHGRGEKVVLWGSSSRTVSFLTTLGLVEEVEYVVDINPYRQGTYMAGTGQAIVGPEFLREYRPGVVVVMNPIYRTEIEGSLRELGVEARVKTVE